MFIYALSIFLTSTDLIKDIFSCKAKSRPCHPERSRTAKQCEVSAEQDLGREQHSFHRRSRCYASPYGFDCGRRMRRPPLRMTRGEIDYLPEGSKKHLWKSLAISAFALLLSLILQSLIKTDEALHLYTQMRLFNCRYASRCSARYICLAGNSICFHFVQTRYDINPRSRSEHIECVSTYRVCISRLWRGMQTISKIRVSGFISTRSVLKGTALNSASFFIYKF